jgi:heat shock protein HtpX
MILAGFRWLLFAVYVLLFCTIPFALLWGTAGLGIGLGLAVALLVALRWNASDRIARRLGVRLLSSGEAPQVHAIVAELSRRARIPAPAIGVLDTSALNLATFGFRKDRYTLVITQGALQAFSRAELTALIGRQLCHLRSGQVPGESWMSQFFALFDWLTHFEVTAGPGSRRYYRFPVFLRQVIFYPLTLYPAFVLSGHREAANLDRRSLGLTRDPRPLAEGLRRLEAMAERNSLEPDFSTRHLFLYTPPAPDPLARVFFGEESFVKRIDAVENLNQAVTTP